MDTNRLIDLIARYQSGHTLEQPFYISSDILDAEVDCIWKSSWLYVGSIAQLPKAGDYFVFRIMQEEFIIIRDNNENIHAHYNSCTHRGSALCTDESGHVAKLICPYHQWVFDKDGTLLNARLMPQEFCHADYKLRSVHIKTLEGLIFICLDSEPPDFESIKNSFHPYLKPFQITKSKVASIKRYSLNSNWKLVAENFRECYHCGGAHPEYCNAVVGASLREDTASIQKAKELIWNGKGLFTELIEVAPGTTSYAVRYPLREGVESYSLDGKRVSIPMGLHTDYDAGVVGLVNYPNFWMDAVSDYIWTMRIIPVSPSITDVEFCWLVDEHAVEGKDYNLEELTRFWEVTGDQDAKLCENNFRGIQTSGYQPGPYAAVEDQVVNFVDWCVEKLRVGLQR
jgi:Rieske 2Fe-2S family protein